MSGGLGQGLGPDPNHRLPSAAHLRATAQHWLAQGLAAVVVEVRAHRGSVPRETGTRMLVSATQVLGTIGGGHLELKAVADARQLLAEATPPLLQRIALGPTLGQCCGGMVELAFTSLAQVCWPQWPVASPRFFLQLYGAGHVGRALAQVLAGIDCQVQWIDEREDQFPADPVHPADPAVPHAIQPQPAHIQRLCLDPAHTEVANAPPGAFYVVMTHSHALDLAICHQVLLRADFGYFGLIGSKTKRAQFEHRLQDRGHSPALLRRLVCPVGVTGITGKEPEVLALAVAAQLLQASSVGGLAA